MKSLNLLSPRKALLLSLALAILTMMLKTVAWYFTGSVGFLSDAAESLVNLSGAGFALWMVTLAMQPADVGHPFGHGKAEYFSAAFEGGMIFFAALAIILFAIDRLINPAEIESLGLGTVLSVFASLLNLLVARVLLSVGRFHNSPALEADGRHLMTDVWTTAGVIVGVGIAVLTGLVWLDPIVAIAVALHILHEGWKLLSSATNGLMDSALNDDQLQQIEAALHPFKACGCKIMNLRTRASGSNSFAILDVRVPGDWSVARAHTVADDIEQALLAVGVKATTHIEPHAENQ